ncbi:MAG: hypothetical protein NUV74_00640 [Candidatus Brocadiaceae bacterium]|nr:hypothetical protein [Candidatus Brocadiaceae bacterium]
MRDALSVVAASLPVPKVQLISAIRGVDMGCIINMGDKKLDSPFGFLEIEELLKGCDT